MSRVESRKDIPVAGRVTLLESDLDGLEAATRDNNERLSRLIWAVVGLIITIAASSIAFAIALGVHK